MADVTPEVEAMGEAFSDYNAEAYMAGCDPDRDGGMRAALAAVEPLIRERVAREIEDMPIHHQFILAGKVRLNGWGVRRRAAHIARAGAI